MRGALVLEGRPVVYRKTPRWPPVRRRAAPATATSTRRRRGRRCARRSPAAPGARSARSSPRCPRCSRSPSRESERRRVARAGPAAAPAPHAEAVQQRAARRERGGSRCVLVVEDLHRIDEETQALLDGLVDRLQDAAPAGPRDVPSGVPAPLGQQARLHAAPRRAARQPPTARALLESDARPRSRAGRAQDAAGASVPTATRSSSRRACGRWSRPQALDGRAGRAAASRQPLAAIQVPSTRAGGAGRPHRPPHAGGQARAAVGRGDGQGRAVSRAGGDRRSARRRAARGARAAAGGRAPLRDELLPRARVHVQARPDPGRGLRQPAPGRRGARCTRASWTPSSASTPGACASRWSGWPTTRCAAGCDERAVDYLRQAGTKAAARSAHREAVAFFEQAIEILDRCRAPAHLEHGVDLGLRRCAPRWLRSACSRGRSSTCAGPRTHAEALGDRRRLGWVLGLPRPVALHARRPGRGDRGGRAGAGDRGRADGPPLLIVATSGSARRTTRSATTPAAQRHLGRGRWPRGGRPRPRALGHGRARLGGGAHLARRLAGRHRRLRRALTRAREAVRARGEPRASLEPGRGAYMALGFAHS